MTIYLRQTAAVLLTLCIALPASAQSDSAVKSKKAWEIGVGGSILQHSRLNAGQVETTDKGYITQFNIHQVLLGGNLSVARELKPWLYLDVQGTIGADRIKVAGEKSRYDKFYLVGPGLQFRFGTLLKSNYFEPYVRVGINYMHKNFISSYSGVLKDNNGNDFPFNVSDQFNKNRDDKKDFFPFSLGVGLNSWVNNRFGIGIQADYIAAFYNKTPHYPMVTLRAIFRLGGNSKKAVNTQIERIVERPVIKTVEVEKVVEKPIVKYMFDLFDMINFELNKADIKPESAKVLDHIAEVFKSDEINGKHFLLTGCTDVWGSAEYNKDLSLRRADAVKQALVSRGVPADMLKVRGVGKAIAAASGSEKDIVREGDRKVTVEWISNDDYWNFLP